eukprot:5233526-Amphidinium_carterae.1
MDTKTRNSHPPGFLDHGQGAHPAEGLVRDHAAAHTPGPLEHATEGKHPVPVRAVVNNVLNHLHSFPTPHTSVAYLKGRVGSFLVPHPSKSSLESGFSVLFLALSIKLELP